MAVKIHPLLSQTMRYLQKKPLVRGMVVYSISWPVSSIIQQSFENGKVDVKRLARFSLYGAFFVAPTLFGWMKFSCYIWPQNTAKHTIIKALVEQISYGPFSICAFLFVMTVLENGSMTDGIEEINRKLIPTWKISAMVWPVLQSINYAFIPERNRLPFLGFCSLIWTIFLTFVKYTQANLQDDVTK